MSKQDGWMVCAKQIDCSCYIVTVLFCSRVDGGLKVDREGEPSGESIAY